MNFVNPGLLGSERFLKNEFLFPIEKKNDEQKMQRLYTIIKPFILRRHKSQVATELPEKVEIFIIAKWLLIRRKNMKKLNPISGIKFWNRWMKKASQNRSLSYCKA
jgi:hypothetical protein